MAWPAWLWIGTRVKFFLWAGNRVATGAGSFLFWKRYRSRRGIWAWLMLLNAFSISALICLFYWLHTREAHHP